jgi:hypothetical protein
MLRRALTASILLLPLLGACHRTPPDQQPTVTDGVTTPPAPKAASISCSIAGSAFDTGCTVEKIDTENGVALMIHRPDGGFRRLLVTGDGRGVVTADGSDQAIVSVIDPGTIQVSVGGDRYRLPATVRGQPLPMPK